MLDYICTLQKQNKTKTKKKTPKLSRIISKLTTKFPVEGLETKEVEFFGSRRKKFTACHIRL